MIRNLCVVVLAAAVLAGCRQEQTLLVHMLNHTARARGLVIVLPGVEGRSPFNEAICQGLVDAGVPYAIDLADWTTPAPMNYLVNLRDEPRNRLMAQAIADAIGQYRLAYPGSPVVLVGQSSGGGMAVWVAEALPPSEQVDGIIALAASLSPGYLLDSALLRSRRGIVNFYSERDWMILGVGTTLSGTMDGMHTSSAGRVGFEPPLGGASLQLYERKLFQIPWNSVMAETGHRGLHMTSGARMFVATYVAPLVMAEKWSPTLVQEIVSRVPPMEAPSETGQMSRPTTAPVEPLRPRSAPTTVPGPTSLPASQPAVRPATTSPTAPGALRLISK